MGPAFGGCHDPAHELALFIMAISIEIAAKVAAWMAEELGWSLQERESELVRYRQQFGSAIDVTANVAADDRNELAIARSKTQPSS